VILSYVTRRPECLAHRRSNFVVYILFVSTELDGTPCHQNWRHKGEEDVCRKINTLLRNGASSLLFCYMAGHLNYQLFFCIKGWNWIILQCYL
jgi:hypothetical protein